MRRTVKKVFASVLKDVPFIACRDIVRHVKRCRVNPDHFRAKSDPLCVLPFIL